MHTFYQHRYALLAPAFCHTQTLFNVDKKAPFLSYDYLDNSEKDEWGFATNLTFTKSDTEGYLIFAFLDQVACTDI
jgi:hypothetical protein